MSQTKEETEQTCNEPTITIEKQERRLLVVVEYFHALFSKYPNHKTFYGRPYSDRLTEYLDQHFDVVIWSSCQGIMFSGVAKQFPKAKLVWGHEKMIEAATLNKTKKPRKDLELVWKELGHDITDTIYLTHTDNTKIPQIHNVVAVSPYYIKEFKCDHALLKVMKYLEKVRFETNVVDYIKQYPFDETHDWEIIPDPLIDARQIKYDRKGDIIVEPALKEQERIQMEKIKEEELKEQERVWMERVMEIEEAGQRARALASNNKALQSKRIRDVSPIQDVKRARTGCSQSNEELIAQVENFISSVSADIAAWDLLNKKK
ncbi:hypothetical protein G6F56_002507 [Rhizopus delemar]|nr:hypothetical protein G6F56_002507 [Rhizopus delemar]